MVIKTWEERDDESSWVDSGVDDQVRIKLAPSLPSFEFSSPVFHGPFWKKMQLETGNMKHELTRLIFSPLNQLILTIPFVQNVR